LVRVRAFADERVVLRGHHRETGAVRRRVPRVPGEAEAERIRRRLCGGGVELLLEVGDEGRTLHLEGRRVAGLVERERELVVRQTGDVVQVERVGRVVRPGDVRV